MKLFRVPSMFQVSMPREKSNFNRASLGTLKKPKAVKGNAAHKPYLDHYKTQSVYLKMAITATDRYSSQSRLSQDYSIPPSHCRYASLQLKVHCASFYNSPSKGGLPRQPKRECISCDNGANHFIMIMEQSEGRKNINLEEVQDPCQKPSHSKSLFTSLGQKYPSQNKWTESITDFLLT